MHPTKFRHHGTIENLLLPATTIGGSKAPTPIIPPFDLDSAVAKVRMAEDAWNTRDPDRVCLPYTEDSSWRNRGEFFQGREAIRAFLHRKWARELDYRLIKELWAHSSHRIAVRFQYEWHDTAGFWHRAYGNEQCEFADSGLMQRREASINDVRIPTADRRFHWEALGARPTDHLLQATSVAGPDETLDSSPRSAG